MGRMGVTWSSPFLSAKKQTMSSVAFPNVALSSPPSVSLVWSATCSVASPSRAARGRIARQEMVNVAASGTGEPKKAQKGESSSATGA